MEPKCPKCGRTKAENVFIEDDKVVCACGYHYFYDSKNDKNLIKIINGTDRLINWLIVMGWLVGITSFFAGLFVDNVDYSKGFYWSKLLLCASIIVIGYFLGAIIFFFREHIRYQSKIVDSLKDLKTIEKTPEVLDK